MREQAAKALLKEPDASKLPILNKALAQEQDAKVLNLLQLAKAAAQLGDADVAVRLESAKRLAESQTPETQLLLNERLAQETDAQVKAQLRKSLTAIEGALKTGERQYFKIILLLTNKKTEQYNTTRFFYIIFLRKLPYLTWSTKALKLAGSFIARSANTLRLSSIPLVLNLLINWL